jgi:hypothetical protein
MSYLCLKIKNYNVMALINCSECGKQISDKATSCPNCGNPINQQTLQEEYLCCPNCLLKHKPVVVDGGLFAVCPVCTEAYDLSYGFANPTKGITKYPLKKYRTIFNNTATGYILRITN